MTIFDTLQEKILYVEITNDGEISPYAFSLLGASTKRDDETKIGYFGSGLKYAIAVLLRNGIPLRVFSGLNEIVFTSQEVEMRGKTFRQIYIDGKPTGMTLEMGVDWEPWFAVREVFCNAVDEGRYTMEHAMSVTPEAGKTKVYIGAHESLNEVFANWNKYFSSKRTDIVLEQSNGKVLNGGNELIVYRKGIRVHRVNYPCLFHYDMQWIGINESRVIAEDFSFRGGLIRWISNFADEQMIRQIYNADKKMWEWNLDWDWSQSFNDKWLEVIGGRPLILEDVAGRFTEYLNTSLVLPNSLCRALKKHFAERVHILGQSDQQAARVVIPMDVRQKAVVDECLSFLKTVGVDVNYPIQVATFAFQDTLGEADQGTIFVSERCFELGKRTVVMAIIEEYTHLKTGHQDKSRAFQTYLLDQYLQQLEKSCGLYL